MIEYSLVTDEWRIGIRDGGDSDRFPDIEPLKALATLTPVTAQLTTAPGDGGDSWNLLLAPITVTYADGRLVGTDGVDGVKVISAINGRPVSWRVERTLTWENQRIPVPTIVVAPTPGQRCHLPDAVPTSPDVDVRQVFITMAEIGRSLQQAQEANAEAMRAAELAGESMAVIEAANAEAHQTLAGVQQAASAIESSVEGADSAAGRAEAAAANVEAVMGDAVAAVAESIATDVAAARSARDDAAVSASDAESSASTASDVAVTVSSSIDAATALADRAEASALSAAASAAEASSVAGEAARTAAIHATAEEIQRLVGDAEVDLDTIYELASAVRENQDGLQAIVQVIGNKAEGKFEFVAASASPTDTQPPNRVTFVMGPDWEPGQ